MATTQGFDLQKIADWQKATGTTGVSNVSGKLGTAIEQAKTTKPMATTTPSTSLSASEYNKQAQAQGRQDWQTAYRTDILKLPSETTTTPTQPAQPSPTVQPPQPVTTQPQTQPAPTEVKQPSVTAETKPATTIQPTTEEQNQKTLDILNEQVKSNPQYFNNLDTFRKTYGYDTAPAERRKVMDAFWQAHTGALGTQEGILNTLLSGQQVYNTDIKQTPAYSQALSRYNTLKQFQTSTGKQISDAVSSGILSEGTPDFDLLGTLNPQGMQEYRQAKQNKIASSNINDLATGLYNSMNSVESYDKGKTVGAQSREVTPVENFLKTLSDSLTKNTVPDFAQAWRDKISQNPEIQTLTTTVNDKQGELEKLNQDEINLEDDIKARYVGNDQAFIDAKIREGLKGIYKAKNSLNIELNTAQNKLSALTQNAKDELNLEMQTYQAQQEQAKEMRGYAFDLAKTQQAEDFQRETMLLQQQFEKAQTQEQRDFTVKQFELQQSYANPDINSDNPQIARIAAQNAVNDQMKFAQTYGIPVQRSATQIVQDAEDYAAQNNISLSQALQETFTKPFQSKPEYQKVLKYQQSAFVPEVQKPMIVGKDSYIYDPSTGKFITPQGSSSSWTGSIGDGKVTFLGGRVAGDYGMDIAGPEGFDVTSPVSGTILTGGSQKDYGTYIEIKADDGSRIRLSHLSPEVAQTIQIGARVNAGDFIGKQENTGTIMAGEGRGVLDVTTWDANGKVRTGAQTQKYLGASTAQVNPNVGFSESLAPLYQKYIAGKMTASDWKVVPDANKFIQEASSYKAQGETAGRDFANDVVNIANQLKTLPGRLGASLGSYVIPRTDSANYKTMYDSFISKLSLQNLMDLKKGGATFGALSNQELKFITDASTALKLGLSDDAYNAELDKIIDKLQKAYPGVGTTKTTDIMSRIKTLRNQ